MLTELAMLARLTRDLPRFLRTPVRPEQAAAVVTRRLQARPARLLAMADRMIFRHPGSPYRRLLEAAGCEPGDFRALVACEGVEGALTRLAEAGIYVTYDEFKGRREAVRGSRRFDFAEAEFGNPAVAPHYEVRTSGTRGVPSPVPRGLAYTAEQAGLESLALDAHGVVRPDHVLWQLNPITLLAYAKLAHPTIGWFYPLQPLPLKARLGGRYLALLCRLAGRRFPSPTFADLGDPLPLARWLADRAMAGTDVCVTAFVSAAVRLAVAARAAGVSLRGVWFIAHGEPLTEARLRAMETSGAGVIARYGTVEIGTIAFGCADPRAPDDVHVFGDRFGLIRRPRAVADSGPSVDALLLTSLFRAAPKILLNVETGDYGILERRACRCRLGDLGLQDHLVRIRSFEKLTGEGMTFVRTNLLRLLEDVLPARFGGTAADYQLLEDEREDGSPRLLLLVSPRVGPVDEPDLGRAFLEELAREGEVEQHMAAMWRRAGTVEIRRQAPVPTRAGKILPFHLARHAR